MLEAEGYNPVVVVYALFTWLSSFSLNRSCQYLNTLYVVGEPNSAADSFVQSLLRLFRLVLTVNPCSFDVSSYAKQQELVKLLYFPTASHGVAFRDPIVNEILKGHAFDTLTPAGIVSIEEKKCIVRLYKLPHPESLPTSDSEHLILRFYEKHANRNFSLSELSKYFQRFEELRANGDAGALDSLKCENPATPCCKAWITPCDVCHSSQHV